MTTTSGAESADLTEEMATKLHWQLVRIMAEIRRHDYNRTAHGAMTLTQCCLLYRISERGRTRMSDLANAENVALPTMTRSIDGLCDLGVVRRVRTVPDHRNVWVEVTPKGVQMQRDAVGSLLAVMRAELTAAEIAALDVALPPMERLIFGSESLLARS